MRNTASVATALNHADEWVDDRVLSQRTGLARATLQLWRRTGDGPPYSKCGRRCLYHWPAVSAWLASKTVAA